MANLQCSKNFQENGYVNYSPNLGHPFSPSTYCAPQLQLDWNLPPGCNYPSPWVVEKYGHKSHKSCGIHGCINVGVL